MPGPAPHTPPMPSTLGPRSINSPEGEKPHCVLRSFLHPDQAEEPGNLPSPWALAVKTLPNTGPCSQGAGTSDPNSVEQWALWLLASHLESDDS